MHRAISVYEPIPPDISSSRHRHYAVHGGGEAHSLSASADRDVLLARCEIAEAYYLGGDLQDRAGQVVSNLTASPWGVVVVAPIFIGIASFILATSAIFVGSVQASTVQSIVEGGLTVATAVNDLSIDGVTYDVSFEYFNYSTGQLVFLGNNSGANAAADAIVAALASSSAAYIGDGGALFNDAFYIPVQQAYISYTTVLSASDGYPSSWLNYGQSAGYVIQDYNFAPSFTVVSSTPLPATLPLFASGGALLGFLGWSRKRKAATVA